MSAAPKRAAVRAGPSAAKRPRGRPRSRGRWCGCAPGRWAQAAVVVVGDVRLLLSADDVGADENGLAQVGAGAEVGRGAAVPGGPMVVGSCGALACCFAPGRAGPIGSDLGSPGRGLSAVARCTAPAASSHGGADGQAVLAPDPELWQLRRFACCLADGWKLVRSTQALSCRRRYWS